MSVKEPPLKQELGPKKYQEKIDKTNSFYDKHMAGKTDPKTGVYYHELSFSKPTPALGTGKSIGCYACPSCENGLSIKRTTKMMQCSSCNSLISVNYDWISEEVSLEIKIAAQG